MLKQVISFVIFILISNTIFSYPYYCDLMTQIDNSADLSLCPEGTLGYEQFQLLNSSQDELDPELDSEEVNNIDYSNIILEDINSQFIKYYYPFNSLVINTVQEFVSDKNSILLNENDNIIEFSKVEINIDSNKIHINITQ